MDFTQVLTTLTQGATGRFDQYLIAKWHNLNNDGGTPTPAVQTLTADAFLITGGWQGTKVDPIRPGDGAGTITIGATLTEGPNNCLLQIDLEGGFGSDTEPGGFTLPATYSVDGTTVTYTTSENDVITQSVFGESLLWYPGVEFKIVYSNPQLGTQWICFENLSGSSDVAGSDRNQNPRPGPRD